MDLDQENTTVSEEEIDHQFGIKKKADADLQHEEDEHEPETDVAEDGEEGEEDDEHGYFVPDKEFEKSLLDPYGDKGGFDF